MAHRVLLVVELQPELAVACRLDFDNVGCAAPSARAASRVSYVLPVRRSIYRFPQRLATSARSSSSACRSVRRRSLHLSPAQEQVRQEELHKFQVPVSAGCHASRVLSLTRLTLAFAGRFRDGRTAVPGCPSFTEPSWATTPVHCGGRCRRSHAVLLPPRATCSPAEVSIVRSLLAHPRASCLGVSRKHCQQPIRTNHVLMHVPTSGPGHGRCSRCTMPRLTAHCRRTSSARHNWPIDTISSRPAKIASSSRMRGASDGFKPIS
jgi:hypothetical protein